MKKNNLSKVFSDKDLEILRGGFTDSDMVISEEDVMNEGDGVAIGSCCNDKPKKEEIQSR